MLKPLFEQAVVVLRYPTNLLQRTESHRPRGPAYSVAFMEQAQAGVYHVLSRQIGGWVIAWQEEDPFSPRAVSIGVQT